MSPLHRMARSRHKPVPLPSVEPSVVVIWRVMSLAMPMATILRQIGRAHGKSSRQAHQCRKTFACWSAGMPYSRMPLGIRLLGSAECRAGHANGTDTVDHSGASHAGWSAAAAWHGERAAVQPAQSAKCQPRRHLLGHRGTTGYRRRSMRKQPRCWRLYCPRQLGAVRWIPGQDSGGWWLADAVRTGLARGSVRGRDFSRPTQPIGQIRRPWLHLYVQSWAHRAMTVGPAVGMAG
jgi:hypothetical protein